MRTMCCSNQQKSKSIYRVLLTPSLLILLLFPLLACGIFYVSASRFASKEAEGRLTELREAVLPVMEDVFTAESTEEPRMLVGRFVRQVAPVTRRMQGDTRLMMFAEGGHIVYPRDEEEKALLKPVSDAFIAYIEKISGDEAQDAAAGEQLAPASEEPTDAETTEALRAASQDAETTEAIRATSQDAETTEALRAAFQNPVRIRTAEGEVFLASIYPSPIPSPQIRYIITYCPVAAIDAWVSRASVLVLLITLGSAIVLIALQRHTAEKITQQFEALAAEAERIGSGDFTPIARAFTIEELVVLSASMNHMSAMLRGARESEQKFYQNVSHDLRTPLMSIGGYAQGIETGIMTDYMHAAHIISEESARLTQYVSDLLTLSRLESGEKFQLERLDLADCIEESYEHMNGLALKQGVELKVEMPEQELLVEADAEQLVRILDNLISNAVRYAHHTVWIQVAAPEHVRTASDQANAGGATQMAEAGSRPAGAKQARAAAPSEERADARGGGIILRVLDDGDGIRESELPHIFERSYKGEKGGFGFGLAIASNAARNMNATLRAGNRSEGGAVFTLEFAG